MTVTTSFELSGLFSAVDPIRIVTETFLLSGRGTVTLTLQPAFDIGCDPGVTPDRPRTLAGFDQPSK